MPVSEQLHPGSNLSERLLPVLGQIRATTDRAEQFGIVRAWFNQHEGDLANDISDLTFLCTLPREERTLLTYPVIGNWVLGRMESFTPQTNHQRTGFAMLRELVVEGRFVNDHWRLEPKEKFNKQVDEFNSFLLKDLFSRLRPCQVLDNVRLLMPCGGGKSFPSSHAANNFAAAVVLSYFYKQYKWVYFSFAITISYSRVYVGVHYPFDVFGGIIFGVGIGLLFVYLWKIISEKWLINIIKPENKSFIFSIWA